MSRFARRFCAVVVALAALAGLAGAAADGGGLRSGEGRLLLAESPATDALPPAAEAGAVRDPRLAEARDRWAALSDSTDLAALQAFVAAYAGTDYATLAAIRFADLRKLAAASPGKPEAGADTRAMGECGTRGLAVAGAAAAPPDCADTRAAFRDCDACPQMLAIRAGDFIMGSPAGEAARGEDEGPTRRVALEAFAVGRLEVTRGEFAAFLADSGHQPAKACQTHAAGSLLGGILDREGAGRTFRDPGFGQDDSHPAVCVSLADAKAYAAWLAAKTGQPYRLLSEAEWEYAARAGTQGKYPFGEDLADACSFANAPDRSAEEKFPSWWFATAPCRDGAVYTAPAGTYQANDFGLFDMVGNVAEWVADCYRDTYAGAPADNSPVAAGDCRYGVLRGGSWHLGGQTLSAAAKTLRSANRDYAAPATADSSVGFRIARSLAP